MTGALAERLVTAPLVADGGRAAMRLGDLREGLDRAGAEQARLPVLAAALDELASPAGRLLAGVASGSPYLWALCRADPMRLDALLADSPEASLAAALADAEAGIGAAPDAAAAMAVLRRLKQRVALLAGLADLGGAWGVGEVTAALTQVADAAVAGALRWLVGEAARAGRLTSPEPAGLFVLAMGKHGAGELNYSSDIDLMVLYDPARLPARPGLEPGPVAVRLTQALVRLLSERTPDGYVFRVDLRLRPDPGATAVAVSLPAAYAYYESLGQNWERAALIKARPCGGDVEAGSAFLTGLAPFLWRRHLDFAAIADIHAMKRQINAHRGYDAVRVPGHDLKLGRGGIREIEFFVQTQQLIAGGRVPALRGRRTLDMLERLRREGWIDAVAAGELAAAYEALRALEHRLQMVADEQTHTLPAEPRALDAFARFAGYEDGAALAAALLPHLLAVQGHYGRLFEFSPGLDAAGGSLVFTGTRDDPETLATLQGLGFAAPERAAATVRNWHFGRYASMRSARAREDLTELTPRLLAALAGSGRADEALAGFDALLARMPAGVALLSLLRANPGLLDLLVRVLGTAPRLAAVLADRPHALDGLIDPDEADADDWTDDGAERRLRAALAPARGFEDVLDRVRIRVREGGFVLGSRLVASIISPQEAGRSLSALAVAAMRVLLDAVWAELAERHGEPQGARIAVLALGKLGGGEMTATSDLDLVMVYDHAPGALASEGPGSSTIRPLGTPAWFARLAQRLIAALSAPTAQGPLYAVDMRLRPSGRQGPVAVHVEAFEAYHATEAWTWERMALTRARAVAGDEAFRAQVDALVRQALTRPRDPAATRRDVADMRARVLGAKPPDGPWDLRNAPGGLVDIEFAAQYLQLAHAADHPEVLATGLGEALDRLAGAGLLDRGAHAALRSAWNLGVDLTQALRLCLGAGAPEQAPEPLRAMLARLGQADDLGGLLAVLDRHRAAVRQACGQVFGPDAAEAGDRAPGPGDAGAGPDDPPGCEG